MDPAASLATTQQTTLYRYGEQTLWSTQLYTTGPIRNTAFRVFAAKVGDQAQGFVRPISIGESNVREAGRTPNGVAYDVYGIAAHIMIGSADGDASGMDFDGSTVDVANQANIVNIMYSAALTWDFTQTQIDVAPLSVIGAGGGVYGPAAVTGAGGVIRTGALNNGGGTLWLYRKHPVSLPGSTTFAMLIRMGNRAEDITQNSVGIKIILCGMYKNVIEVG
jgi:hypothetical protein